MFHSRQEYSHFERNLVDNRYRVAYDVLTRRYVYIQEVVKDAQDNIVILAYQKDGSRHKYSPGQLVHYGFWSNS